MSCFGGAITFDLAASLHRRHPMSKHNADPHSDTDRTTSPPAPIPSSPT